MTESFCVRRWQVRCRLYGENCFHRQQKQLRLAVNWRKCFIMQTFKFSRGGLCLCAWLCGHNPCRRQCRPSCRPRRRPGANGSNWMPPRRHRRMLSRQPRRETGAVAPIIKPVVVAPVAPQPAPVVVSAAGDNADQAAARAAVRRKLNELEQQSPTPPSAPVQSVAPVVVVPVKAATPAPAPTPAPVIVTTPAPVPAAVNANAAFHPIPAPALPISGSKAERLQALDAQYKSGLITPQDYFTQREALLNGQ